MFNKSKSILAKLLASENITVEHRKTATAYFDTKNRVMVLPIWKKMTTNLYDLLMGHEVGHAIFTPEKGWHDNLKDVTKKGYKTYLNVIEDIRIEKKIQVKFPGLKSSFTKGYNDLMENDFFGIKSTDEDLNALPFIDRINLHYKVGSFLNIKFSEEEKTYFPRLDKLETWQDVEKIVAELYQRGKEELRKELEDQMNDFSFVEGEDEDEAEGDDETFGTMRGLGEGDENLDPESKTDRMFRDKEKSLIDDRVAPYVYVNMPTANLEKIIVPYKRIKQFYNDFKIPVDTSIEQSRTCLENAKTILYKKFNDNNKKYISYLIKEFELKRNARQYARANVSKTGQLDMKKVYAYRYNEDLFKRMTIVPKGKSHGLLMFIDYSGSMTDNIQATIEQTIVLATFCRKVNIPFRVYAFTDQLGSYETYLQEMGILNRGVDMRAAHMRADEAYFHKKFSSNVDELNLNNNKGFRLREYLSSEMSGIEFKDAVKYWLLAGEFYTRRARRYRSTEHDFAFGYYNGNFEQLNGTPLNETIVASIEIVNKFKADYKLDVVNTVFLTDGDANETVEKYGASYPLPYCSYGERKNVNVIIRDKKTMSEGRKPAKADLTIGLLNLLKDVTGVNVIGFFIVPDNASPRRAVYGKIQQSGKFIPDIEEQLKTFKKNKFFLMTNVGYDDLYIIPGGDELLINEDEIDVEAGASKNELKKAFLKMQKGKSVNRILLSRFAEKIA